MRGEVKGETETDQVVAHPAECRHYSSQGPVFKSPVPTCKGSSEVELQASLCLIPSLSLPSQFFCL